MEETCFASLKDPELKIKFALFSMFMLLVKEGKDPVPYMLSLYL